MTLTALYNQLCKSYTEKNLNTISSGIIACKKNGQHNVLKSLLADIQEITPIRKQTNSFASLIQLYHPDKLHTYTQQIKRYFNENNFTELEKYSHIFIAEKIEDYTQTEAIDSDIDYAPEYGWDYGYEGYSIFEDSDEEDAVTYTHDLYDDAIVDKSFLGAVKRKVFGHQQFDFPVYQLEELEDIDMAEYEIDNLDGIQFCTFVESLDLSGNFINDLIPLSDCKNLKYLNLSNNDINYIDALAALPNLRQIDLSFNMVRDISPLFYLQNLEYINVQGNVIPASQLKRFETMGIRLMV